MAIEMATSGTAPSLTVAAAMVGLASSTVMHHRKSRKPHLEESQCRQKPLPEEERDVPDRCYFHCRLEFPPTIWQLCEMATTMVQKRIPNKKLGKR